MKRKKVFIPIAVVAVGAIVALFAMGLLSGNETLPNSGNSTPTPNSSTLNEPSDPVVHAINPGKVFVENCQLGEVAEYYVEIYNDNDAGIVTHNWTIITEVGQTECKLPLNSSLVGNTLDSVLSLKSNNDEDKPVASKYDEKTLVLFVSGLQESTTRILTGSFKIDGTLFSVDYRYPDKVAEGYSKPSEDTPYWLWISDKKRPIIPAHGTYTVTIRLTVPANATPPPEKWEFWIGVIDQSQTGNVITELAQRWLITMG